MVNLLSSLLLGEIIILFLLLLMSKILKLLLLSFFLVAIYIACILHSQYISQFYLNKCMDEYPRDDLELMHNDIITLYHFPYVIKITIEKSTRIIEAFDFKSDVYLFGVRLSTHENWLYLGDRVIYIP